MSFRNLSQLIAVKNNASVLGLDPAFSSLPPYMSKYCASCEEAADAAFEFCAGLIVACADIVAAVKPQAAYFEQYGVPGVKALKKLIDFAKSAGLYVILDAKRGDIGATSEAYAAAVIGKTTQSGAEVEAFDADCVTVNPYLGSDGVMPFVDAAKKYGKSIFVLVKTSNPSSDEFQNIITDGGLPLYMRVAAKIKEWGDGTVNDCGYSDVGAVVGATYPRELAALRAAMPETFFLVPGYGAQGGTAADLAAAFDKNGSGACVNASRSIMCAYKKAGDERGLDYKKYARAEAERMRDEINAVRFK